MSQPYKQCLSCDLLPSAPAHTTACSWQQGEPCMIQRPRSLSLKNQLESLTPDFSAGCEHSRVDLRMLWGPLVTSRQGQAQRGSLCVGCR